MLPAIDGSRDYAGLRQVVADAVASGNIVFLKSGAPISEASEIESSINEHVESALQTLARSGLLVA